MTVTVQKLRRATNQYKQIPTVKKFFDGEPLSGIEVRTSQGRTAYWLLWCSGSAIMSVLGIGYRNRSLVDMAETLREKDPGWNHDFLSDLDCLDQYNGCGCEVVVTRPILDLEAMWEALERDREALWDRIEELCGLSLESFLQEERERAQRRREERAKAETPAAIPGCNHGSNHGSNRRGTPRRQEEGIVNERTQRDHAS